MPIYELECTQCHNKVEKLFTCIMNFLSEEEYKAKQDAEWEEFKKQHQIPGYELIDTRPANERGVFQTCEMCGGFMELIPSLTAMQPDTLWAGQMVHGKYMTSKSFLNRYEKQNHLERVDASILNEVKKKSDTRISKAMQKSNDNLGKFLEKELSGVEISNDGNTVKEQNKFIKARS